ncbi:MAG: response regulator transcription factor [Lachnospiraceae bacterium]|nr:response regulator transcription factor [Lachnospiraceae bacterium]
MAKEKILIIEDNDEINSLLQEMLKNAGYEVKAAYSGPEGFLYFGQEPFNLVLLDLMLPGMSGEVILEKIREKSDVPVIIISAKNDIEGKVNLLGGGADDYITKPFDVREVLARIELQLKKKTGIVSGAPKEEVLVFEELRLDPGKRTLFANDTAVSLTKHEYNLIELLMKYPEKIYSKQELFEMAWDEYYIGEDKTINVHISNIRKKLAEITGKEYIDTVWGIGVRLKKQ